jgi:hypothetical protein
VKLTNDSYKEITIAFNGNSLIISTSEDMDNQQMFIVLASVVKHLSETFEFSGKTEDTVLQ